MIELSCLCGNTSDFTTEYEQNFTEAMLTAENFSPRGKYNFEKDHWHYRIVRCKQCSQLFSTPILEAEKIERFYGDSSQTYSGEAANIVKSYLTPLTKRKHLLKGMDTVLEVGCGSGYCLQPMKKLGFQRLFGVEPSVHAVAQANKEIRPFIINAPFEQALFDERSIDLVNAFQVLDHFIDPTAVMDTFHRILKPGGLCYAIVHNERALQVKLLNDRSPIVDIAHIYLFNKTTLKRIFEKAGFEVVDSFNIWNAYTLRAWLRMAPIPLKEAIMKGVTACKADNITISIPVGNIGLIGRKVG